MGHLCDTLYTSTCSYLFPPVSTDAARRDRPRDDNLTAICRILPYSAKSTESCQVLPGPLLKSYSTPCTCRPSNQTNDIYPFFPFPYLLSSRNVLTLLHSLYTQLNNIYFAIYYRRLYSLRDRNQGCKKTILRLLHIQHTIGVRYYKLYQRVGLVYALELSSTAKRQEIRMRGGDITTIAYIVCPRYAI